MLRVVLDRRRQCEQQFPLGDEQMSLGLGWYEIAERGSENPRRLIDETCGADATGFAHGLRSEKVTQRIPSSRRPLLTRLPLSTRGSEISRL